MVIISYYKKKFIRITRKIKAKNKAQQVFNQKNKANKLYDLQIL